MDARFTHLLIAQILTILVGIFPYIFRRTRIAVYFAGAHVCLALWCLNESVAFLPASHAVKLILFRLTYAFGVAMVWFFFHFLLGIADMPVSRFPRSWRLTQIGGAISLALTLTPWQTKDIVEYAHPFKEVPGPAYPIFILFMLWGLGFPLYQLGKAYSSTHGHTRTQLKYLFFGSCFAFLEGSVFFASLYFPLINYYYFYLQVIYSVVIAYAIFAHHLMDIRVIVRKTLEYSLITVILGGFYIGFITCSTYLVQRWTGISSNVSATVSAVIIALLFHPLRLSTQAWLNKKFFRQDINPRETLDLFSGHLINQSTAQDIADALLETVMESLHFTMAALYLRTFDGSAFEGYRFPAENRLPSRMTVDDPWIAAAILHGTPRAFLPDNAKMQGIQEMFPLRWSGGLIGLLLVGEKLSEEPLTSSERRLIDIVLQQTAVAYEQILFFSGQSQHREPGALADVARGFVHEIKTPLANIHLPIQATMLDLEALAKGTRSAEVVLPKIRDRMKFIMTQAVKASERIDAIRDFAAVEDTHVETVDLSHVVNESISSLEPLLEQTGVRVHFQPLDHLALVRGNPKQLEIVFVNLVKNAAEAMASPAIPVQERHLWATFHQEGAYQVVAVKDSGPGISQENMDHIFERYFTTKGTQGTGIGLYFTRQLVNALGGTIEIASQPGAGATFTVKLPAYNPQNAKAFRA